MKTKVSLITLAAIILVAGSAFRITFQPKPWPVPDKFVKMANPVTSNAESLKEGKELWVKHCQSCHGKSGHGDGPKAATLKTEPCNFALPATQKQSDGSLFYKISEGRDDMPSFKKKADADELWSIVDYMRTLK